MNSTNDLFRTRQHFEVLDGMRGVAAISVVIFHFMEIAVPDYTKNFIGHGYLAVDFFFCLSGFVIGYAYDQRLLKLGNWNFFKLRLIRLHPLVVFGSIIGILVFILDPWSDLWKSYSNRAWLLFGTSALMIPYPVVKERFLNLFHLNPPLWSLFWEYVINIFYALVLIRVRKWMLAVLVILSCMWLYYEAHLAGNLSIGWGSDTFRGGIPRVAFSFMAGLLLYRLNWVIRSNIGFFIVAILLLLTFLSPYTNEYNHFVDPTIVLIAFPLMIGLGAGTMATGRVAKLCRFLGDLSYPLYLVHNPFVWLFMSYVETHKPSLPKMYLIAGVSLVILIAFAWAVLKLVDEPVRRWLKSRLIRKETTVKTDSAATKPATV